jgi:hypothetical protein
MGKVRLFDIHDEGANKKEINRAGSWRPGRRKTSAMQAAETALIILAEEPSGIARKRWRAAVREDRERFRAPGPRRISVLFPRHHRDSKRHVRVGCNISSTEKAKCVSARVQDSNGAALGPRTDLSYRRLIKI